MKKIFLKYILLFLAMIILFNCYIFLPVSASEEEYAYSYTYNGINYYSNESVDDAWYQAMQDNFEKGLITEDQIKEEYAIFSRRNIDLIYDTYDNQSDLTSEPTTYVNGYLTWTTSLGYVLPLKNVRVDLYNDNVIGAEMLESTYTNADGYYCFEITNDTGLFENGGYDVYIKCYPDSYTFEIARDWIFTFLTYYYFETEPVLNITSGSTTDLNISLTYDESDMAINAFYASQGLVIAQNFAIEMGMETSDFLHVIYPYNDDSTAFCLGEYSGISKSYFNDFDTLMHEYGHFVEGVLGNYGSDLIDIILFDPSHFSNTDHFHDKNDKQFAMELTWSESWATAFAQIAQHKYLSEYYGKIPDFGDISDDINYENFVSNTSSCEAQEDAVIASLWDLFDSTNNETYDNLSLTYIQWWGMTTRNNIQTLTDFFEVVNMYYPEYRSQVGEIFGAHQISPSNFTIINLNDVSEQVAPQFSWVVNGSIYNPNNQFQITFYNKNGNIVYQTETFTSNLQYYQTYIYVMPQSSWTTVLSNFRNLAEIDVVVQGFNSSTPISGPYNSNQLSLNIEFDVHECSYTYQYMKYNSLKHKSLCTCGKFILNYHSVKSTVSGRYKPCIDCGYLVDTFSEIIVYDSTLPKNDEILKNSNTLSIKNEIYKSSKRKIIQYYKDEKNNWR